jgi:hypothetical protein
MENEKKLEYYIIKPSLKQFYGIKVNKDTKFDEETDDKTVKQHFEDLTLTTTVTKKIEANENYPYDVEENSKTVVKMPEDTILIWIPEEGFVLPQYEMTNLSGLEEDIKDIKNVYKESKV